jgi:hypothetical protein
MHVVPKLSTWSSLQINSQTKPPLPINPTSPCGIHPNLEKILDQCKARKKVNTCDNVILQPIDNRVSNCMFNIFMTCVTTHFHFPHILKLNINQTPNLQSISTRFCFHVLLSGWVFSSAFDHHFIHTNFSLHSKNSILREFYIVIYKQFFIWQTFHGLHIKQLMKSQLLSWKLGI